jgi:hypothetical protein
LVEKYRSRERERKTRRSVPNLLRQSLSASPERPRAGQGQGWGGGGGAGGERSPDLGGEHDGVHVQRAFSPAAIQPSLIRPLAAPLAGFAVGEERHPRFAESAAAQSMGFEEREALQHNILEVQK